MASGPGRQIIRIIAFRENAQPVWGAGGHQKKGASMNRLIERLKRIKAERHSLYDAIPVPAFHSGMRQAETQRQIRQSMDVMNQLLASPDRNQAIAALREM